MGGIGSGRKCRNSLTTELYRLNARLLQRFNMLEPSRSGRFQVRRSRGPKSHLHPAFRGASLHASR